MRFEGPEALNRHPTAGTPMKSEPLVFSISPRTLDTNLYWSNICAVATLSEKSSFTGVLLFTGNDTYLEPWLVSHDILRQTNSISPLVAVNPIYMHPFTTAKMITSLIQLHKRRIYLNMVTGTALSYQTAMGDRLTHDERYERLAEYIQIIKTLIESQRPLKFSGKYYSLDGVQLLPRTPPEYSPEFLLAGQSAAAKDVCKKLGCIGMQMLPPQLDNRLSDAPGMHLGIVTRETEKSAWDAAHALFPRDEMGAQILDHSMSNTDSSWKRKMKAEADSALDHMPGYWLDPFSNFKADCPYLVGSYSYIADTLRRFVDQGITCFILDIPASAEEFGHVHHVLRASGIRD